MFYELNKLLLKKNIDLIKGCQQGAIKAQEQLYKLYSNSLFALCLKYAPNYQEAQDVLHDSFMTIFDKINQYKYNGSFEGWIKRITINTALQRYKNKGLFSLTITDDWAEEEVEFDTNAVDLKFLLTSIQELPNQYRLVFNLYVLDGYSHKEIAEMLDIAVGTSKSNLNRAKKILRNKIAGHNSSDNTQIV